jgi:DNA-binding response OmpR family regulator
VTRSERILAVEDEARNSALLEAILVRVGYDLTIAANLAEARAWLRENRPGLVLLDRHLPDGDGLDIAREMKADATTADVPILLVSASVLPVDRGAAKEAGCDGFLDKPLRIQALLEEVERHLGR